jgi:hypothetical protein
LPTSQYPERFFDVRYIVGCCRRCNAHGGQVKSANRANRMTISHLEQVVRNGRPRLKTFAPSSRDETSSSPSLAAPSRASSDCYGAVLAVTLSQSTCTPIPCWRS